MPDSARGIRHFVFRPAPRHSQRSVPLFQGPPTRQASGPERLAPRSPRRISPSRPTDSACGGSS